MKKAFVLIALSLAGVTAEANHVFKVCDSRPTQDGTVYQMQLIGDRDGVHSIIRYKVTSGRTAFLGRTAVKFKIESTGQHSFVNAMTESYVVTYRERAAGSLNGSMRVMDSGKEFSVYATCK